jgi:hypothetical protein
MPGFRRGNGGFNGLQVSHFTDQNNVGILPQSTPQSLAKARHIDADFPLINGRFLAVVIELDGIFDRNDMVVDSLIQVIHHARQRRAFARSRGTRDQEKPARPHNQPFHRGRQPKLLHRQQLVRNLPQNHGNIATLLEHRDAEACHVSKGKAKVATAHGLQFLLAAVGRDAFHQRNGVGRLQNLRLEFLHVPVMADHRRLADRNVQVARALLYDRMQEFVDQHRFHRYAQTIRPTAEISAGLNRLVDWQVAFPPQIGL